MSDLKLPRFPGLKAEEPSTSPADRFAFKLFRELTRGRETSNVFFSPFSVMLCQGSQLLRFAAPFG